MPWPWRPSEEGWERTMLADQIALRGTTERRASPPARAPPTPLAAPLSMASREAQHLAQPRPRRVVSRKERAAPSLRVAGEG
jgi:hypothetical protein